MNLDKIFCEEDLFTREFANYETREYGMLFFDESNKDSYDSNHRERNMSRILIIEDENTKAVIDRKHKMNLFKLELMPVFEPELE